MEPGSASPSGAQSGGFVRKLLIDLSVMTVIGVFLALIGPLGSINDPLAMRLIVWLGLAYAGYFIYSPVGWFVDKMHGAYDLPKGALWVAGTLIATIPMAVVVWSLNQINSPVYRLPTAEEALIHYGYVLVIGGAITLLFNVVNFGQSKPEAAPVAEPQVTPPAVAPTPPVSTPPTSTPPVPANPLLDQIPAELGSDVIALEMEDHYVRVHTALGSELVLMRLRDAMVHVADIEGQQVHRSWWVARGAVEDVEREGRNVRLKLARDVEAPVSRANVSVLKDAGWF